MKKRIISLILAVVMLSLSLGVIATLLFVISLQPYAATFAFAMLSVKVAVMIKRP